ncbi:MAG: hypothetical protein Q8P05_03245 [Candidatus Diapherotrites archaeon]|nr:hypothetical protein [Candidatus Diapherotrites archaeon]MDZ4256502.1 hypothetical protein [archaeon]
MIEFTLSKINLLILVVALFGIISFFTFNLGGVFLVNEVKQELDTYSATINASLIAPTTCDSKPFSIPPKFKSFGSDVFYTLSLSQIPDGLGNRLIFSASDIRKPDLVLAASSLATDARIVIFSDAGGTFFPLSPGEEYVLDPQSVPPRNAFYMVKSVMRGNTTLYLIPCAISAHAETCQTNKQLVNQFLTSSGEGFVC